MKTIFIPRADTSPLVARAVADAGFSVVQDGTTACDFSVCAAEQQIETVKQFCSATGTPMQNLTLLHKPTLVAAFAALGFPTLSMTALNDEGSLANVPDGPVVLKPAVGAGARRTTPLAYSRFESKAELLAAITPDFWQAQAQASEYDKLWAQSAVGVSPLQTILDGFVNGAGEVVFTPCVERTEASTGSGPLETFAEQLPAEVQQELQDRTRQVVTAAGVRNSFFMMQFIRSRNEQVWYPIDFQYRLSYPHLCALSSYNPTLSRELMQFVYDVVPAVSVPTDLYGYVRRITVNVNNRNAKALCEQFGVVPMQAFFVPDHIYAARSDREIMFTTYAASVAQAKANMDGFQQAMA